MKTAWKEKLRLPRFDMVRRTMRSERGISLIVVIMLMVIILAITGAGLLFSSIDLKVSGNYRAGTQAFYAADTGASTGFAQIGMNTATSIAAFSGTANGGTYCSGTIANTAGCTAPKPLVSLGAIPATGCSLGIGTMLGSGACYLLEYQIDATGVGPLSATRQVQALATFGPLN
jgi:Tfp pilus assembly protein PilX